MTGGNGSVQIAGRRWTAQPQHLDDRIGPLITCIPTTNIKSALHKSLEYCRGIAGDTKHAHKHKMATQHHLCSEHIFFPLAACTLRTSLKLRREKQT